MHALEIIFVTFLANPIIIIIMFTNLLRYNAIWTFLVPLAKHRVCRCCRHVMKIFLNEQFILTKKSQKIK